MDLEEVEERGASDARKMDVIGTALYKAGAEAHAAWSMFC